MNPYWKAILERINKLQVDNGYLSSSRGAGYSKDVGGNHEGWHCVVKFYPKDSDLSTQHVYEVSSWKDLKGGISTKVDGPYIDSGDQYWLRMAKDDHDSHALITPEYMHYTVSPDSEKPGQGDGFGGSEFRIELFSPRMFRTLQEQGFRVQEFGDALDANVDHYILYTRNLWQQGKIPEAHRHLFTPNCKVL